MTPKRHTRNSIYLSTALTCIMGAAVSASAIEIGPLNIGGAIRANYVQGDYVKNDSGAPQRGGNGGNFEFDTFRINLDFEYEGWIAEGEYRFYDGGSCKTPGTLRLTACLREVFDRLKYPFAHWASSTLRSAPPFSA